MNLSSKFPKLFKLAKFSLGSVFILIIKTLLTIEFSKYIKPEIGYLYVHLIIFFLSYFYHVKVTFNSDYNLSTFKKFTKAVIGIKILDYFIFSVIFKALDIHVGLAVILATLIIFILRFYFLDKFLNSIKEDNAN